MANLSLYTHLSLILTSHLHSGTFWDTPPSFLFPDQPWLGEEEVGQEIQRTHAQGGRS